MILPINGKYFYSSLGYNAVQIVVYMTKTFLRFLLTIERQKTFLPFNGNSRGCYHYIKIPLHSGTQKFWQVPVLGRYTIVYYYLYFLPHARFWVDRELITCCVTSVFTIVVFLVHLDKIQGSVHVSYPSILEIFTR